MAVMGDEGWGVDEEGYSKKPFYPAGDPAPTDAFPEMPAYQTGNAVPLNIPELNTKPLTQIEDYVNSGSDNPWVKAQKAALEQNQAQAMGAAKSNATAGGTAAADMAAARGGLTTGAAGNLARTTANNETMAGQNVIGEGLRQGGAIETGNATNQLGMLANLPGQEVQALQPALQTASLNQAGLNAQNEYNLKNYATQVAERAGIDQADAAKHAGKK